jgi:hypothetical protein
MTDIALVKNGVVTQVWRDTPMETIPPNQDGTLVLADASVCCGMSYTANGFGPPPPPPLAQQQAAKIAELKQHFEALVGSRVITVTTSSGSHSYKINQATRDNLMMALVNVTLLGSTVPQQWTPHGATEAILLTEADVKAVAGAIGQAYEALMATYQSRKAAIATATAETIAAYDLTTGWPA